MKREIIVTKDGSSTISLPELNECYHSRNGAIQEAYHVFIERGLKLFPGNLSILEIGFGTGLNAFITLLESQASGQSIHYTAVEAYPVDPNEILQLNYVEQLHAENYSELYLKMHDCHWELDVALTDLFTINKKNLRFENIDFSGNFDLIYFDAFGYDVQPELWTENIFHSMYNSLKPNGVLVTYAARSIIKRNMESAGFVVQKLAGPPGKREMMRAFKGIPG
ncbi:MAG TPA: tRNA (5-methylaminomethyl-2-thiouridine)(34)-methyltransferase MnmD [Flavobacterium sp.]